MSIPTFDRPVLMAPQAQMAAAPHLARYLAGRDPEGPSASHVSSFGGRDRRPYAVVDGVGVIGVSGLLVPRYAWIGDPWITGYDALSWQIAAALADTEVAALCLEINSGGGFSEGCFDLCDWIMTAKAAARKTVAAICSETAYSAAYAIGSVCDGITVPRTGGLGSVGVWTMHVDYSAAMEKAGVAVTLISAGSHKVDGHPYAPLPDDVRADRQALVEDLRRLFAETVAKGRSLSVADVLATEARCYDGPRGTAEAVRLGLADAVASPADAFAALAAQVAESATIH